MSRLMERNLTEFEESLSFDVDDPDFAPNSCIRIASYQSKKSNYITHVDFDTDSNRFDRMTSIQNTTESLSRHRNNTSLSCHSLYGASEDNYDAGHTQYQGTEVLIENIRLRFNSCFTCGVSWSEEHVSLDCSECGGYSMQRPCPRCNGRCHSSWKRDVDTSHRIREAKWIGECGLACGSMEESLPAVEKLRATS